MRYAVILAGGGGLRMWPLSRRNRPKQLLRLFGGTSLLRAAFDRAAALFPPERIYVITHRDYVPMVADELPELPAENILGEPMGRDTATAVGLSAAILVRRDSEAVIGVFPADHMISPKERYGQVVDLAFRTADRNRDALVTFGIRPTRPETNFGYIQRGRPLGEDVFEVLKFAEKPNVAVAMKYLAGGEYFWNSGMFAWRASTILDQLKKHLPQVHSGVQEIAGSWDTPARQERLDAIYPNLMRISIDFAVLEHADRILAVEMDCHWVDVGSWPALESLIQADADGNVNACPHSVHLGSRGNIVVSEEKHLIATIGVDDLVIVRSPDATLICTKRDTRAIRELLENIQQQFGDEYA
jgi:mannose-1-phosphate guanylyltransferase